MSGIEIENEIEKADSKMAKTTKKLTKEQIKRKNEMAKIRLAEKGIKDRSSKWIKKEARLAIYMRDNFRCLYCGDDLRGREAWDVTLDHVVPQVLNCGGKKVDDPTNLVTACRTCNGAKKGIELQVFTQSPVVIARVLTACATAINLPLAVAIVKGKAGDPRVEME